MDGRVCMAAGGGGGGGGGVVDTAAEGGIVGGDGFRARGERDRDLSAFLRAISSVQRRSILLDLGDTSRLLLRPSIPVQLNKGNL